MDTGCTGVPLYCDCICCQIALDAFCVYTRCFALRAARSDCVIDVESAYGKRVDVARRRGVLGRVFTNFYTEGVFCCYVNLARIVIFERNVVAAELVGQYTYPRALFCIDVSEPEIVIACPSELLDVFTPTM